MQDQRRAEQTRRPNGTLADLLRRRSGDLPKKCPRCDSMLTKFCYFNNYSAAQPRHYCKACCRHWTEGGVLRNVPVGGCKTKRRKTSSFSVSTYDRNSSPSLCFGGRHHHRPPAYASVAGFRAPLLPPMMPSYDLQNLSGFNAAELNPQQHHNYGAMEYEVMGDPELAQQPMSPSAPAPAPAVSQEGTTDAEDDGDFSNWASDLTDIDVYTPSPPTFI